MEHAVFWQPPDAVPTSGYARLYLGSEFCPWTFPPPPTLLHGVALARAAGLAVTLVTPVCAERFLPRLHRTLTEILPQLQAGDEVVLSDWGALAMVRELAPHLPLVLGRVLSGQKRGAQILDLDLRSEQLDYFRQGSWYAASARELLAELGIARIELDNTPQGLAPLPAGLRATLHTPYAMVTSSRNCPFRNGPGDSGCSVTCGEVFTLATPQSRLPMYQAGNTQFLRLDVLPTDLAGLGVDRLVVHQRLPR